MSASDALYAAIGLISVALEAVAAIIIVSGGAAAIGVLVRARDATQARHAMSQMLLLALDFTIGADILKGVAAPADLSAVAVVAVVVLIRLALTFALQRELRAGSRDVRVGNAGS